MKENNTPTEQIVKLVEQLKTHNLFKTCDNEYLTQIVEHAEIVEYPPHETIWVENNNIVNQQLALSIILEGAVLVSYDPKEVDSIYEFNLRYNLIGEFEWFDIKSRAKSLTTITKTTLVTPDPNDIKQLAENHPQKFYENIIRCFVSKAYHKNEFIDLLSHIKVVDRLKYLLLKFQTDWRDLTINSTSNNSYEIDIFWSDSNISTILRTEFRTVRLKLADLVEADLIKVSLYKVERNKQSKEKAVTYRLIQELDKNYLKNAKRRRGTYIKITVLDADGIRIFFKDSLSETADGSQ